MGAVAICAAYLGVAMGGAFEVRVRSGVAGQAARVNFLRRSFVEDEDFALVAAAGHVLSAGAVTAFAALVCCGFLIFIQHRLPVRRLCPTVVELFVTGLAGFGADV